MKLHTYKDIILLYIIIKKNILYKYIYIYIYIHTKNIHVCIDECTRMYYGILITCINII